MNVMPLDATLLYYNPKHSKGANLRGGRYTSDITGVLECWMELSLFKVISVESETLTILHVKWQRLPWMQF